MLKMLIEQTEADVEKGKYICLFLLYNQNLFYHILYNQKLFYAWLETISHTSIIFLKVKYEIQPRTIRAI